MAGSEERIREALRGIASLYRDSLSKHGLASQSVGWKDEHSHRLRFEKLCQLIPLGCSEITVNDWGCGYGALFSYLEEVGSVRGFKVSHYFGYDISDEMLASARRNITDPRVRWIASPDATETADYTFVSGTFNVRLGADEASWAGFIRERLLHLWGRSRKGLAFNLLTTYVGWRERHLYYADPLQWFDFCKRDLSRYVTLLHEYPLYEWTMIVLKDGAP